MTNLNILAIVAAALYVVAAVVLLLNLTRVEPTSGNASSIGAYRSIGQPNAAIILAVIAVVIHAVVAIQQTGLPETLQLPLLVSMNVATLFIVCLLLAVCLRQTADYLGLAVYPSAAVFLLLSSTADARASALSLNIQFHVLLSLTAYAFLSLAAAQAVLVWLQRKHLQTHKTGGFMRALPALDQTEQLLFTLLAAGFAVLTLSLATGIFYLDDMFTQSLVHKTVLSILAWAIFGTLLFARWRWGWRGKRAVFWALIGFLVLILAYFGSKFVLEIVLNRT